MNAQGVNFPAVDFVNFVKKRFLAFSQKVPCVFPKGSLRFPKRFLAFSHPLAEPA